MDDHDRLASEDESGDNSEEKGNAVHDVEEVMNILCFVLNSTNLYPQN